MCRLSGPGTAASSKEVALIGRSRSKLTRLVALFAALALAVLALPASGAATEPTIEEFEEVTVDAPLAVCNAGTAQEFTILSSNVLDVRAIVFEGTVDEPVHAQFHVFLTGTLTNSVTGTTVHDMAHSVHLYDAERGTHFIAGIEFLTPVPEQGVVVADVGLLEYGLTEDGEVLVATHGPHDVFGGGGEEVEVFCPYLA
jgi:hypothetical protein